MLVAGGERGTDVALAGRPEGAARDDRDLVLVEQPLAELLAAQAGAGNPRKGVETNHRLQAFSSTYFSSERLFSYSQENCDAALALRGEPSEPAPFFTAPLSEPEPAADWRTISLETLVRFFAQPAGFFLTRRLRLSFSAMKRRWMSARRWS